jgi:hypothetical protein
LAQTVPAAQPPKEEAAMSPSGTERDPQNRPDAIWIQAKLGDLGYFSGSRNGVWGGASRGALRDFKCMNGLPENDRWDKETEQRLSSREVIPASKTFIGGWAEGGDQCGSDGDHSPPIVISSRAAKTEGGECDFRSIKREGAGHWRVDAVCTSEGNSWNANIDLKLSPPNLIWTSERGTTTYVRCGKPWVVSAVAYRIEPQGPGSKVLEASFPRWRRDVIPLTSLVDYWRDLSGDDNPSVSFAVEHPLQTASVVRFEVDVCGDVQPIEQIAYWEIFQISFRKNPLFFKVENTGNFLACNTMKIVIE